MASARAIEDMRDLPPSAANMLFNELDLGPEFDAFAERTHAEVRLRLGDRAPAHPVI